MRKLLATLLLSIAPLAASAATGFTYDTIANPNNGDVAIWGSQNYTGADSFVFQIGKVENSQVTWWDLPLSSTYVPDTGYPNYLNKYPLAAGDNIVFQLIAGGNTYTAGFKDSLATAAFGTQGNYYNTYQNILTTISFMNDAGNTVFTFGVNGLKQGSAAAIPEPETYAMLLVGLGMVGAVARRRKQ
ncbi:MAG: PEP-CTERM sorting domain-containing protein [Betaproteobacteria bacterium]|nr:PEP-CTERM sorting domain-containing protein [Betaproteobacteria bacterium]